jgi:hypothetical protein
MLWDMYSYGILSFREDSAFLWLLIYAIWIQELHKIVVHSKNLGARLSTFEPTSAPFYFCNLGLVT